MNNNSLSCLELLLNNTTSSSYRKTPLMFAVMDSKVNLIPTILDHDVSIFDRV